MAGILLQPWALASWLFVRSLPLTPSKSSKKSTFQNAPCHLLLCKIQIKSHKNFVNPDLERLELPPTEKPLLVGKRWNIVTHTHAHWWDILSFATGSKLAPGPQFLSSCALHHRLTELVTCHWKYGPREKGGFLFKKSFFDCAHHTASPQCEKLNVGKNGKSLNTVLSPPTRCDHQPRS